MTPAEIERAMRAAEDAADEEGLVAVSEGQIELPVAAFLRILDARERLAAIVEHDHETLRVQWEKHAPLEMEFRAPLFAMLAAEARGLLGDAKNYVNLTLQDDLGKLSVLIQKLEGETPASKATRLEAELATLRAAPPVIDGVVVTWRTVFYAEHKLWGHIVQCAAAAVAAGYPFFAWNGCLLRAWDMKDFGTLKEVGLKGNVT